MGSSFNYKDVEFRRRVINVDSRSRNISNNPQPNPFELRLDDEQNYSDVVYCKLISAIIPATDFNVSEDNNGFSIIDNGVQYDVLLPPCDYDINSLIVELTNQVTPLATTNVYTFSVVCGRLQIEGTGGVLPFQFLFESGPYADKVVPANNNTWRQTVFNRSARNVLGFDIADYTSTGNPIGVILSPNKINLLGEPYLLLNLEQSNTTFEIVTTPNANLKNVFFKLPLSAPRNAFTYLRNDYDSYKSFTPVIKNLKELKITLLKYSGKPYNFQGVDYSFQLEIGTLK